MTETKRALVAIATVVLIATSACSSAKHSSKAATRTPTTWRTSVPAAVISGPVTPASGVSLLLTTPVDDVGYRQTEYFASGAAESYRAAGRRARSTPHRRTT